MFHYFSLFEGLIHHEAQLRRSLLSYFSLFEGLIPKARGSYRAACQSIFPYLRDWYTSATSPLGYWISIFPYLRDWSRITRSERFVAAKLQEARTVLFSSGRKAPFMLGRSQKMRVPFLDNSDLFHDNIPILFGNKTVGADNMSSSRSFTNCTRYILYNLQSFLETTQRSFKSMLATRKLR